MKIEVYELKQMLTAASEIAVANYVKTQKPASDRMSQREAYAAYGEGRVKMWLCQKMIRRERSGATINSKYIYSRAELMAADKSELLATK